MLSTTCLFIHVFAVVTSSQQGQDEKMVKKMAPDVREVLKRHKCVTMRWLVQEALNLMVDRHWQS